MAGQLAHLDPATLDALLQQAQLLRSRSNDRTSSFDSWVERAMKKETKGLARATDVRKGTVVSVYPKMCSVESERGLETVLVGNHVVVVGDNVQFGELGSETIVVRIEPRFSKLSRPDVGYVGQERLIAANIDIIVIAVSVSAPPLHPRIIDRFLAAIRAGGASPVICVNKIDLLEDEAELELLKPYQVIGIPVIFCSANEGIGIDELRDLARGKTVAFVGHSGVGKSSLMNAFAPELGLVTGSVSEGYGRGTHTTTVSSLHRLESGTTLIDTPGIRKFGLWAMGEDQLLESFPEIAAMNCRFSDCAHVSEPGCGVLSALAAGTLSEDRYNAYLKLRSELV